MKKLLLALVAVASSASALAQSAVPNLMSYQSRVADAAGVPLGNTTPVNRIVLFRIYDSPNLSAPANRLYSEQQTVTIAAGEFSVLIGSGTAIATESTNAFSTLSSAVFGGATRYLGVTVDDGDGNPLNDPEMSPRQQIVGTPFAFRAQTAEAVALGGVTALSLANNAVTTAAIAPGAVTGSQLAPAAVDTTQVADNAVTLAKHASNSVDSSKIVDGSVALADLSPALAAVLPKTKAVYNQGVGTSGAMPWILIPMDVGDLVREPDGCVVSYTGIVRSLQGQLATIPKPQFSGFMRISISQILTTGTAIQSVISSAQGQTQATAAGTIGETANFFVQHFAPQGTFSTYTQSDLGTAEITYTSTAVANATPQQLPVFQLYTFYPGHLFANNAITPAPAPFNTAQANTPTNPNAGGPSRSQAISSVVSSTNKLTITVDNPHAIQVGDTVTIAGVTGAPSANGTFTVTAQPDRVSFEVALTGATGTYTGGTVTYTPKYNKNRLWAAVRADVAMRIVVSAD